MAETRDDIQDATGRRTFYAGGSSAGGGSLRGFPMRSTDCTLSSGVPTNGSTGFLPGATWQNYRGSTGSVFYINVGTVTSAIWVELTGSGGASNPVVNTAITTVGAGTLTAASMVGGLITRSGPVAAFTDTTDTAAAIIAAWNVAINQSRIVRIVNTTAFPETIAAGSGVTLTGNIVVGPNSTGEFLMTYTGAGAISFYGLYDAPVEDVPAAQFSTGTTTVTFAAGQLTGAQFTVYTNTGATPGSIATRSAAQMFGDFPGAFVGQTYMLRIINGQGTGILTVTAGSNVTLTGTATIAINTWRDFVVTFNSATTATIQNAGTGTFS